MMDVGVGIQRGLREMRQLNGLCVCVHVRVRSMILSKRDQTEELLSPGGA